MDQLSAMLNSNFNDLVASKISSDRRILSSLSNDVCLIGLCSAG